MDVLWDLEQKLGFESVNCVLPVQRKQNELFKRRDSGINAN